MLSATLFYPALVLPSANATEPESAVPPVSIFSAPRTLKEAGLASTELSQTSPSPTPLTSPSPATPPSSLAASTSTYPTLPAQVNGSFTSGPGAGYDRSFIGIDGFVPLTQTPGRDLTYLQGRLLLSTDGGNPGGNVLVGYRRFNPTNNSILGGYLGYDVRNTGKATFNQLGAGVEGIWSGFEARLNGYLPVGNTCETVDRQSFSSSTNSSSISDSFTGSRFQGNSLLLDIARTTTLNTFTTQFNRRQDQVALAGLDAEVGLKLLQWQPDGDLRSYLGLYHYSGSNIRGFVGVRGRLVARINQYASVGLSVQGDPEFGTTAAVTVGLTFPGVKRGRTPDSTSNWARMGDSPYRSNTVAVTDRTDVSRSTTTTSSSTTTTRTEAALNPTTGQPYVFQHAVLGTTGGDGTFENPFGTVAAAITAAPGDSNGIVYVQPGTNPGIPAFTIRTTGASGLGILLFSLNTSLIDTIAVSNNTINTSAVNAIGISVNPRDTSAIKTAIVSGNTVSTVGDAAYGIIVNPRNNGLITNMTALGNTISTAGTNSIGILMLPINSSAVTAMTASNNRISTSGVGASGIFVQPQNTSAIANALMTGNTIAATGANARGIYLDINQPAATLLQATISNNTITQSNSFGIQLGTFNFTQATATISNNSVSNAGALGIVSRALGNSQLRVIVDSNQVSGVLLSGGLRMGISVEAYNSGQLFASVTNNRVTNTNAYGGFDLVEYKAKIDSTSNACVRFLNNIASNSGYVMQNTNSAMLRLEPFLGNVGTRQPDGGVITNVAAGFCSF